jgi:hypothetical protein
VGKYSPTSGALSCIDCVAGKESTAGLPTGCDDCARGYFSTTAILQSAQGCEACDRGRYQGTSGSTSCHDCTAGQYTSGSSQRSCNLCRPGKYNTVPAQHTCVSCDPGQYNSEDGSTSCIACEAGRFGSELGAGSCAECSPGHVQPLAGQVECEKCPSGKIQNGSNYTVCVDCPRGHASNDDGLECSPCEAGRYLDGAECRDCDNGEYQPQTAAESCLLCPAGQSGGPSRDTRRECDDCSGGRASSELGSELCESCSDGKIQNASNFVTCEQCPAGKQSNLAEEGTHCVECPTGRSRAICSSASDNGGSCDAPAGYTYGAQCEPCAGGRHQSEQGADSCDACPPGRHSSSGESVCHACPAGTFAESEGTETDGRYECPECESGTFQPLTGQSDCFACSAGRFSSAQGATSNSTCEECLRGSYNDLEGRSICKPCQKGRFSHDIGRAEICEACSQGQFSNREFSTNCKDCPLGTDVAARGAYKISDCSDCNPKEACLGGGECSTGYTSGREEGAAFCAFCSRGYFKLKDNCHKCPSGGYWVSILAGVVFIGFAFLMLGLAGGNRSANLKERASMSTMKVRMVVPFTIAITRFQINLNYFQIDIQWPPGLLDWLKWVDFALNLDFGVVVSPECVADFEDPSSAFIMRHVAMGAVFPVMCAAICIAYLLSSLVRRKRSQSNVINPMVATWQITFINSAKLAFRSFDCTQSPTGYRLDAAPDIRCDRFEDERYTYIFWTGMWVGLVYCIAIPIALFGYLYRADKSDIGHVQSHFGWVFMRYHPGRWYYEGVLLGQKGLAAAITVFMASKRLLLPSLVCSLLASAGSLGLHQHFKPFPAFHDDPKTLGIRVSDNLLEVFGLVLQMITLTGGIIFYYRNANDCNADGTCQNICQYCYMGRTGGQSPLYNELTEDEAGFIRRTKQMARAATQKGKGAEEEPEIWLLSGQMRSDPQHFDHDRNLPQCELSSESVDSRYSCFAWCKDESPETGRHGGAGGIGMCYYSGFRDSDDTKADADNGQYIESNVETAVTVVILTVYMLFIYMFLTKSAKTWRTHLAKQLGIGLSVEDSDGGPQSYMSLEDAADKRRQRATMIAIFERLDADQSHTLSIDELKRAMDHISTLTYAPIRSDEVASALMALDEDNSGEVEMMEFMDWITNDDDELAQHTALILADVASASVALSSKAEMGESVEYSLTDHLRLQFIKEVLDAKALIADASSTNDDSPNTVNNPMAELVGAVGEEEDELSDKDENNDETDASEQTEAIGDGDTKRAKRLAYVQHRLHADADVKEGDIVYNMGENLDNESLRTGPQFGLSAARRYGSFYSRAEQLHQKSCADGCQLIVVPFGTRGGELMYIDEHGMPMPLKKVFEVTQPLELDREIDPQSPRIGTLAVGSLIEVLEEKSFAVMDQDSDAHHHQMLSR